MRRSIPALAIGFAGYGALIVGILALTALGVSVLAATGGMALAELVLSLGVIGVAGAAIGGPFLATAWGLHRRRSWARWPALVLALLVVGSAPLGTALGGYTFYTLLDVRGLAAIDRV